jgi:hypothetical protein
VWFAANSSAALRQLRLPESGVFGRKVGACHLPKAHVRIGLPAERVVTGRGVCRAEVAMLDRQGHCG